MPVTVGEQLGSLQIVALLGKGGMGEVYRARDTRLKRDVAIKVLPDEFSRDPDRLSRFQREAEALASLNHPNIALIHSLEQAEGAQFLVLELVSGETLEDRLKRGALPLDRALNIAIQICEALQAAHERNIVHRDLKPSNVKITLEGAVKILDFGLAKIHDPNEVYQDLSNASSTLAAARSEGGVILGTVAYMSPEQARGNVLDKRTDIWAFGCVLYEMLTGRKVFARETFSDTIAAILDRAPGWSALPENTPPMIRRLLQRCLEKDMRQRLHDIADARIEISDVLNKPAERTSESSPQTAQQAARRPKLVWGRIVLALMLSAAALAGGVMWKRGPAKEPSSPPARLMITLPAGQALERGRFPSVALSPDGKLLVYAAAVDGGRTSLYMRPMDELVAQPIPATEGASTPFFSPDGRWLGFYANGLLKKMSVAGGVPLTICEAPPVWSASWGDGDRIVFATALVSSGLSTVSANGGEPAQLTTPKSGETQHGYPQVLAGGGQVLFSVRRENAWYLALLDLKTHDWRLLGNGRVIGEGAQYLPTGHLVYTQAGGLVATPFDPANGNLDQPPVPLLEHIETSRFGGTYFAFAAETGTLVYVPANTTVADRTLMRVDRDGRAAPLIETRGGYEYPAISPDGRNVAVTITSAMGSDIWIIDLNRATRVRFTSEGTSGFPVWGPDGSKLAFQSTAPGPWNLFWKTLDGGESQPLLRMVDSSSARPNSSANLLPGTLPVLSGAGPQFPISWAPDGSAVAFHERKPNGERDIWVVSPGSDPVPFLLTAFDERLPRFSPDGKWLAYVSDEAGRNDVYVQPFPGPGAKWLVSTDGGTDPVWSRNGRELFYRQGDQMMAVTVTAGTNAQFPASHPQRLFEMRFDAGDNGPNYDVSPDGRWFVIPRSNQALVAEELHVVLNWFNEVSARTQSGNALRTRTTSEDSAALRRPGQ